MKKLILSSLLLFSSMMALAEDDFDLALYGDAPIEEKRTFFEVKIFFVYTKAEIARIWNSYNTGSPISDDHRVKALAVIDKNKSNPRCYVYVPKAESWDDREAMAVLGHEIYHCMRADHGKPIN